MSGGNLSDVGRNALIAAGSAAASAGVAYAIQNQIAVSRASAAEAKAGGGSGAARVEKAETVESVISEAGYGTGQEITDFQLLMEHPGSVEYQATHAEALLERTSVEGTADAKGAVVRLLKNGGMKAIREVRDVAEAVIARRQGKNVVMRTDQAAGQVERAAFDGEEILRHKGHDLGNGEKGFPHYQTEGRLGHTFWGGVVAFVAQFLNPFDNVSGQLGCGGGESCYQRPGL
jgi:hypothetical protein